MLIITLCGHCASQYDHHTSTLRAIHNIHYDHHCHVKVKMFIVITMAYLIFWGPLFIVTLANYTDDWKAAKKSMAHEVDYPWFSFLHCIWFVNIFRSILLVQIIPSYQNNVDPDQVGWWLSGVSEKGFLAPGNWKGNWKSHSRFTGREWELENVLEGNGKFEARNPGNSGKSRES